MNKEEYAEYLKSDHWQEVRSSALGRAEGKCQLCGDQESNTNVHHNTYDHLGEERDSDVIVLCTDCHAKFHDKVSNTHVEDTYASLKEQYYNIFVGVTSALLALETMDNPYKAVCTNTVISIGVDAIIYQQEEMGLTHERYEQWIEVSQ